MGDFLFKKQRSHLKYFIYYFLFKTFFFGLPQRAPYYKISTSRNSCGALIPVLPWPFPASQKGKKSQGNQTGKEFLV